MSYRHLIPIAAATALALTGCASNQSGATTAEIQLRIEAAPAAPGDSVVMVLQNTSSERIGYNLCSSGLERQSGGAWQPLQSDRVCTMELRTLEPGAEARYTLPLPADLAPGSYRAVTSIERLDTGTAEGVASEPFRVEP